MNKKFNRSNPKVAGMAFIQGDVAGLYVDVLPENAVPCEDNIIALGEVTGHSHIVEGAQKYKAGNQIFVVVDKEGALLHDKHAPWILPAGVIALSDSRGIQQIEYLGDEERQVLD
jgi:hypothetical protein